MKNTEHSDVSKLLRTYSLSSEINNVFYYELAQFYLLLFNYVTVFLPDPFFHWLNSFDDIEVDVKAIHNTLDNLSQFVSLQDTEMLQQDILCAESVHRNLEYGEQMQLYFHGNLIAIVAEMPDELPLPRNMHAALSRFI